VVQYPMLWIEMVDNIPVGKVLSILASYLEEKGVRYVVVGGIAVLAYGYPRATQDIDLIVDQRNLDVASFCEYLRSHGFLADENDLKDAFREKSHATIFHSSLSLRLDVKGVYSVADKETLHTAVPVRLGAAKVCLTRPENLICHKLLFGSARDLEDALAVYTRMKPQLAEKELRRVARLLGVEEALQELIIIADRSIHEQQEWIKRRREEI